MVRGAVGDLPWWKRLIDEELEETCLVLLVMLTPVEFLVPILSEVNLRWFPRYVVRLIVLNYLFLAL